MAKQKQNTDVAKAQEDYIKSLELSVKILRKEVDDLRKNIKTSPQIITPSVLPHEVDIDFLNYSSTDDILQALQAFCSKMFDLVECTIFRTDKDRKIDYSMNEESNLIKDMMSLEEEGILDWICENKETSIIPNTISPEENNYFFLSPIALAGEAFGIFIGKTPLAANDFNKEDINEIEMIAENAAAAAFNILSLDTIANLNRRMDLLNKRMLESAKFSSLGELTSSFSEEIEAPLMVINTNLDLMESGVGNPQKRIDVIKNEINKIYKLNSRIKKIAASDFSKEQIESLNICSVIDEVILFTKNKLEREGIELVSDYEDDEIRILAIKPHLEQAIMNLILYSSKYMPDGGAIKIGVYSNQGNRISINISDNGIGIDDEIISNIFEPYSVDSLQHGLGLYISKYIIEQHYGRISVLTEQGRGTTFKLSFPGVK
jgi:signal transduction histidine kinase